MGRRRKRQVKDLASYETENLACQSTPLIGRHLVAKRDIKKGELLIQEPWLLAGPSLGTKQPVCIGCHSPVGGQNIADRCIKCHWFVCGESCSKSSPFHTPNECDFFVDRKIMPPEDATIDFGVISVLCSLLLKQQATELWTQILQLQSHSEERKRLVKWKDDKILVDLIRKTWNLGDSFTTDEIFHSCGILEVNGFEMGDAWSFQGIFVKASMISHDCVPNCSQSENIDELCLEVTAIMDIPAGTPITLCYDSSLEGTRWRQLEINKSKYFLCNCKRCQDPTELGTNFSTLICSHCKTGIVIKESLEGFWNCSKCSNTLTDAEVDTICKQFKQLRKEMDTSITSREEFLKKCASILHANHFIPFKIKFDLSLAYGHDEGYSLVELTSGQVGRKLDLCISVMKVLDILCPGQSVARGNILYELQAAQALTVRQCLGNEKCSRRLLRTRLKTAMSHLREAIDIFQLHYSLRMLAKNAREVTLVELNEWLRSVQ